MSSLLFLGLAGVIFVLGSAAVMFFNRERNTTFESSIDRHRREMDALAKGPSGRRRR